MYGTFFNGNLAMKAFGTFFHGNLAIKAFLQPFFCCFMQSSCHLLAKGCALSTGKLLPGGLPRNSVVRVTDQI